MKYKAFIILILILMAAPVDSHAFGLFKWTWDAVANQLGLDRGPIPKVAPKPYLQSCDGSNNPLPKNQPRPFYYIQADGF